MNHRRTDQDQKRDSTDGLGLERLLDQLDETEPISTPVPAPSPPRSSADSALPKPARVVHTVAWVDMTVSLVQPSLQP